jgi:hypothetical protein
VKLAPLRIHNNGGISISPGGLVLQGQLETLLSGNEIEQPFYVYGHLHSKEFHRKGKECPFLQVMKPENTILFLSPTKAVSMGYNGCRFCYSEYDTAGGQILLYFRDLDPNSADVMREASLHFELLKVLTPDTQEVKYDLVRSYAGQFKQGVLYFNDAGLPEFFPGTWRVQLNIGLWSTTVKLTVKKWGKQSGKSTHATFTVGVQGCGKAFGKKPPYPEP